MKYRTFSEFWDAQKTTRSGQCYGLLVIGMSLGLLGALKAKDIAFGQRAGYGLVAGLALGVLLILVMVIPSMYLAFIRKKKTEGKSVVGHRVLLVLYFFPFLTFSALGSVAFVINYFTS
jgi:hypothetical protein